jgi:hypothetical protein
MPTPELPQDEWHTFVYVFLTAVCCSKCETEPDLMWAWDGIEATGEAAAEIFALRAVEHLKAAGWVMHEGRPCCPACATRYGD